MTNISVRAAALEAFELGYSSIEANRILAIAVHNGFAKRTLKEDLGSFDVIEDIQACAKHNVEDKDYYGMYK